MPTLTLLTLAAVFGAVAFLAIALGVVLTSSSEPTRRRLNTMLMPQPNQFWLLTSKAATLADEADPAAERLVNLLPTSLGSVKRLRRDLALAGFYDPIGRVVLAAIRTVRLT